MNKEKWFNIVVLLIVISFFAPKILTIESGCFPNFDSDATANIGSTIGGLMSPFISIAIVIVTWLAFNEQFEANKIQREALENQKKQYEEDKEEQRKNIELQKFENQFYQMLRLHKENVNEIEIKTFDGGIVKGREAFFQIKAQLDVFLFILSKGEKFKQINESIYTYVYNVFFGGYKYVEYNLFDILEDFNIEIYDFTEDEEICSEWYGNVDNYISYIRGKDDFQYVFSEEKLKKENMLKTIYSFTQKSLNIPLENIRHHYLAHYFRHLFHMVKFVANQDEELIPKPRKLDYLRMVRAQLSNHEQMLLFYNWLGGDKHGGAWENDKNEFFTKYKMIHNLWYDELYKDDFIKEKLKELVGKYKKEHEKDTLFEIGDDIDAMFK